MILIKGMEMPKGCASCFLKYGSCASIRKRTDESKGDRWCPENYRHPDCPLIEVPEDVQPVKHGQWINICGDSESPRQCSECLQDFDYIDGICYLVSGQRLPPHCPNCGARMDVKD